MNVFFRLVVIGSLLLSGFAAQANDALASLQLKWAQATYQTDGDARVDALTALADEARTACLADCAEPGLLIWKGIITSSLAGEKGGLGALGLAKEAKSSLEAALDLDDQALDGSAYTSLGTLYHKVPGWPIGFGNDKKAQSLMTKALKINPTGIDANYFMGEYLYDEGEYAKARTHLLTAQNAPARPGRQVADAGRQQEVRELLAKIDAELN